MTGDEPMSAHLPFAAVVTSPIDPAAILDRVGARSDGAALLFIGIVRDHDGGRAVSGVHYEAYQEMAARVLEEIAAQAAKRIGTSRIAVTHRTGELDIGEVSVAIAVSSPHRAEAYEASRWIIEEIKRRLPIWKKERYVDGDEAWLPGVKPEPTQGVRDRRASEPAEAEAS